MAFGAPFRKVPNAIQRGIVLNQTNYPSLSHRLASRRLTRAVTLLARAGRQLDDASRVAPDRHNRNRLRLLATGLRDLSIPLSKIASYLERGGAR
jgi:hypothetical protein